MDALLLSHAGNRGSKPLRGANKIKDLAAFSDIWFWAEQRVDQI